MRSMQHCTVVDICDSIVPWLALSRLRVDHTRQPYRTGGTQPKPPQIQIQIPTQPSLSPALLPNLAAHVVISVTEVMVCACVSECMCVSRHQTSEPKLARSSAVSPTGPGIHDTQAPRSITRSIQVSLMLSLSCFHAFTFSMSPITIAFTFLGMIANPAALLSALPDGKVFFQAEDHLSISSRATPNWRPLSAPARRGKQMPFWAPAL